MFASTGRDDQTLQTIQGIDRKGNMKFLEIKGITKRFGGLIAVDEVSFDLAEGEILGLVGPNGAGKTTLFNCISGYYLINSGKIVFRGEDITNRPPYTICTKGIARTFQIVQNFEKMTVLENIMVGMFLKQKNKRKVFEKSLDLIHKKDDYARNLSPPEQRRLGLGMALATRPKLLMLDETMAGLTPTEIDGVLGLVKKIRDSGVTVIIIEHVMRAVMTISGRIIVLDSGKKIAEGKPDDIAHDDRVIRAYLGRSYARS
jgi:branched-chain amino acid transport system ATP-binding protein